MIRKIKVQEKESFNALAAHPLQSWEWGEFRIKTGIEVIRLGRFENKKLKETAQITIHPIPFTSYKIGYFPKGNIPSVEMLKEMRQLGNRENLIFIKLEPNVDKNYEARIKNKEFDVRKSPHPLFTCYTFHLDLTKNEEELLKAMSQKTRYNIRLAEKKGVKIKEEESGTAFNEYLKLTRETTDRQKFYAHTENYHRLMWETLGPAKIARLFTANFREKGEDHILVTWIVFLFNGILYYPYGASSTNFRNLMASNLMMWEVIKFGKKQGAKLFDMWGALGPDPNPNDPWYGFHRFKEGYGAKLTELAGSYDLVIKPAIYSVYNLMHYLRELYLKIRK